MGNECTSLRNIESNEYLLRLCSTESVLPGDLFWTELFAHALVVNDSVAQDAGIQALFSTFCNTTLLTDNLANFVAELAVRADQLKHDHQHENVYTCWQMANAIAIMRVIVLCCVETCTDEQLLRLFNTRRPAAAASRGRAEAMTSRGLNDERRSRSRQRPVSAYGDVHSTNAKPAYEAQLLATVVQLLTDLPLNSLTYFVHLECLQLLLSAVSIQAYRKEPVRADNSVIHHHLFHGVCSAHSNALLRTLLNNWAWRTLAPARTLLQIVTEYGLLAQPDENLLKAARKIQFRKDELRLLTASEVPIQPLDANAAQGSMLYNATAYVATTLLYVVSLGRWYSEVPEQTNTSAAPCNVAPVYQCLTNSSELATVSVLVFLVLSNQCVYSKREQTISVPAQRRATPTVNAVNPYREALLLFVNQTDKHPERAPFAVDFENLYKAFAASAAEEHCTLALYLLLHRNVELRAFILEQDDLAPFVLPMLHVLYEASEHSAQHVNMAMIVLLIISESEDFAKSIHDSKLSGVSWYKERVVNEITLGSLLILVVIRVMQWNVSRNKQKYLQSNALATLLNLCSNFRSLHPYVTQRILSLMHQLLKRRDRLTNLLNANAAYKAAESSDSDSDSGSDTTVTSSVRKGLTLNEIASGKAPSTSNAARNIVPGNDAPGRQRRGSNSSILTITSVTSVTSTTSVSTVASLPLSQLDVVTYENEIEMLEELVKKWLEIINICLLQSMHGNVNLIYALLYERELIAQLKKRPQYASAVKNLDLVLKFISDKIEAVQTKLCVNELSVEIVHNTIRESVRLFSRERLKRATELKFKYIEEDNPERYFVPYVWSLIYRLRPETFLPSRIELFEVVLPPASTAASSSASASTTSGEQQSVTANDATPLPSVAPKQNQSSSNNALVV